LVLTREPAEVRTQAVLSVVVGRVSSMVPLHAQPDPQRQQLNLHFTSVRLRSLSGLRASEETFQESPVTLRNRKVVLAVESLLRSITPVRGSFS